MLLSHRETWVASADAGLATHAAVHRGYRFHLVERANVVSEDAIYVGTLPRVGHLARPVLTVILAGRARIRACGAERWLEPGDVSLIEAKTDVEMRQDGERFVSLAIEWDPGTLGTASACGFTAGRLGARVTDELGAKARALRGPDLREASEGVAGALEILRAAGAPFDPVRAEDLVEPVPVHLRRLNDALDDVLSHLDRGPSSLDLESALGLGARQVNRLVAEYNSRYGSNATNWRDTRKRRQLLMGSALMTAARATVERVAAAVGYGSARAFNRALADAGMPSPSNIAARVRHHA